MLIITTLMTSCVNSRKELQNETQEPTEEISEVDIPLEVTGMQLTSHNFKNKGNIPTEFTCQGEDISPHLAWTEIPEGTKSFALSVTDPDAIGRTWMHWLIINIPADVTELQKDSFTMIQDTYTGIQVPNDFVKPGYGGPCPPSGKHRYFFTLYALDVEDLGQGVNLANFFDKVDERMIAKAELIGMYEKQK